MHLGDFPLGHIQFGHRARFGRSDLHQRLVGHDLDDGLVFFDGVAFGHSPLHHFTLDDAFTDIR